MIDDAALRLVKPGAVLINCGRGGLLDLDAAYAALLDGRLSGVGLDVFDPEPPHDHPLFHHPDVVLTPHVMALSRRARALVFEEMAAGMDDVLSGRRAPAIANPDVYRPDRRSRLGGCPKRSSRRSKVARSPKARSTQKSSKGAHP